MNSVSSKKAIWKPTQQECDMIRSAAKRFTGNPTVQPGLRYNTGKNTLVDSMNIALVSELEDWSDTDLGLVKAWADFRKGVELTEDGRAIVDFYVYNRDECVTNLVAFYQGGELVEVRDVHGNNQLENGKTYRQPKAPQSEKAMLRDYRKESDFTAEQLQYLVAQAIVLQTLNDGAMFNLDPSAGLPECLKLHNFDKEGVWLCSHHGYGREGKGLIKLMLISEGVTRPNAEDKTWYAGKDLVTANPCHMVCVEPVRKTVYDVTIRYTFDRPVTEDEVRAAVNELNKTYLVVERPVAEDSPLDISESDTGLIMAAKEVLDS